jgi:D-inositol-3-phosphate glycosyltransferase
VGAGGGGGALTPPPHGVSGVLIDGHEPIDYARAVRQMVRDPACRELLSRGAVAHAARFGWSATVDRVLDVYSAL